MSNNVDSEGSVEKMPGSLVIKVEERWLLQKVRQHAAVSWLITHQVPLFGE